MPQRSSHLRPALDYCVGLVNLHSLQVKVGVGLMDHLVDDVTIGPLQT